MRRGIQVKGDKKMANEQSRRRVAEELSAASLSGGGGGDGSPPRVVAGAAPQRPWSLTEEFNRAAGTPSLAVDNPDASTKKQIDALRKQMSLAAAKTLGQDQARAQTPASRQKLDALMKKLSQPRPTYDLTPLGSVRRHYSPESDRRIVQEANRVRRVLNQHKGMAKQAFNKSTGIGT